MKLKLLSCMIGVALLSCSGKGNQFIGEWKVINESGRRQTSEAIVTIREEGENFILMSSLYPEKPVVMTYLEKEEMLTGNIEGGDVSITFSDSTQHLLLKPYKGARRFIEFAKNK